MKVAMLAAYLTLTSCGVQAFVSSSLPVSMKPVRQGSQRSLSMADAEGCCTRSQALNTLGAAVLGIAGVALAPSDSLAASSADVNRKLNKFDLPPVVNAPDGFATLLESYGSRDQTRDTSILGSSERDPILVTWNYPKRWVVERPSMDTNREAGTVSTGDYGRGDSAALFVAPKALLGGSSLGDKAAMEGIVRKALSQKGDNQFQSLKLKSVKEGSTDFNGNTYYIADFQYELLTGAGFTVERKGFASVTQIGKGIQALVAATTANRAKDLKKDLQDIVYSFRVYPGNYQI